MGHRQKTGEGGVAKMDLILSLPQLLTATLNTKNVVSLFHKYGEILYMVIMIKSLMILK